MKRRLIIHTIRVVLALLVVVVSAGYLVNGRAERAPRVLPVVAEEPSPSGSYALDPAHSTIGFTVRHLVINDIPGRFRDFAGSIQYNSEKIGESSVTFMAKAASVDTAIEARDKHLRTSDFFDVEKYPEITFKSTRIERKGAASFVAHGDFTMRGVTRVIAIPFKLHGTVKDPWGKTRLGVEGGLTINRNDYGITWGSKLDNGGLVIGNDVKINLLLEAVKQ